MRCTHRRLARRAWLLTSVLSLAAVGSAVASDHNEPSPSPVWPFEGAVHAEWDLSDLFAWHDASADKMNFIVAWHPQQLPLEPGERAELSDQVLFRLHVRYERSGLQLTERTFDRVIDFRYGQNEAGQWGCSSRESPAWIPSSQHHCVRDLAADGFAPRALARLRSGGLAGTNELHVTDRFLLIHKSWAPTFE